MTTSDDTPLSQRISAAFATLSKASAQLNLASDELARLIGPLDDALKHLNLGVNHWHTYRAEEGEYGHVIHRLIGYAKVAGKWGIALSQTESFDHGEPIRDEEWIFNEAPRLMRIEAVDHLPQLLESLAGAANDAAMELTKKVEKVRQITAALPTPARARGRQ